MTLGIFLRDFVASATTDKLGTLFALGEAEHKLREQEPSRKELEQLDAMIQLLEHGKDPQQEDS